MQANHANFNLYYVHIQKLKVLKDTRQFNSFHVIIKSYFQCVF